MKLLVNRTGQFVFHCGCGHLTKPRFTMEGAGREADLHMAKMYPTPTERRPCPDRPIETTEEAGRESCAS